MTTQTRPDLLTEDLENLITLHEQVFQEAIADFILVLRVPVTTCFCDNCFNTRLVYPEWQFVSVGQIGPDSADSHRSQLKLAMRALSMEAFGCAQRPYNCAFTASQLCNQLPQIINAC